MDLFTSSAFCFLFFEFNSAGIIPWLDVRIVHSKILQTLPQWMVTSHCPMYTHPLTSLLPCPSDGLSTSQSSSSTSHLLSSQTSHFLKHHIMVRFSNIAKAYSRIHIHYQYYRPASLLFHLFNIHMSFKFYYTEYTTSLCERPTSPPPFKGHSQSKLQSKYSSFLVHMPPATLSNLSQSMIAHHWHDGFSSRCDHPKASSLSSLKASF